MADLGEGPILIFANGVLDDGGWVASYLGRAAAVIAADGGLRHLLPLGHRPDVLIGDMDSVPPGVDAEAMAAQTIRYPRDKNETDLELALLHAVTHYPDREVLILGGFGGRFDHMLANVLLLAHPRLLGRPIRFVDDRQSAWLLAADPPPGETIIAGAPGDVVSLLPLSGPAHVLATTGLRWPLHDEVLAFGAARGVSNEMTAAVATVRLGAGVVLCIHVRQ